MSSHGDLFWRNSDWNLQMIHYVCGLYEKELADFSRNLYSRKKPWVYHKVNFCTFNFNLKCVCKLYVYHLYHVLTLIRHFWWISRQWFLPGLEGLVSIRCWQTLGLWTPWVFCVDMDHRFYSCLFLSKPTTLACIPRKGTGLPRFCCCQHLPHGLVWSPGKDFWFKQIWVLAV